MKRFKKPAPTAWRCIVDIPDNITRRLDLNSVLCQVFDGTGKAELCESLEYGRLIRFHVKVSPATRLKHLPRGVKVYGWRVA